MENDWEVGVGIAYHSARVENPVRGARDAWRVIWPNKGARLAIVAMAVSQMAMVAVMVMTPLHMKDFGHAELSTLVIAVHVLGMFGLSGEKVFQDAGTLSIAEK